MNQNTSVAYSGASEPRSPHGGDSGVRTISAVPSKKIDFALPEHCSLAVQSEGLRVVVCQTPKPDWLDKWAPSAPSVVSVVIACVALFFSWRTYQYNVRKDRRARLQSISDDFWLRKIVSPNSIEPFLKFTVDLRGALPDPQANPSLTAVEVQNFWVANAKSLNDLIGGFQLLDLVDAKLFPRIQDHLDAIGDVLAEYCGALRSFIDSGHSVEKAVDRAAAVEAIQQHALGIFSMVANHQSQVGTE